MQTAYIQQTNSFRRLKLVERKVGLARSFSVISEMLLIDTRVKDDAIVSVVMYESW